MTDTIYVYENHKITGPDGYNADIIKSGKDIKIEGTDNIILKWEKGKYIISNNFIEVGNLKRSSVLDYSGNIFIIPKDYIKNSGVRRLNFPIYYNNKEIGYINRFKNTLNINIEKKDYIIPVVIYVGVISTKLKEKFGILYMKARHLSVIELVVYSVLGISLVAGFEINSSEFSVLSMFIIAASSILSSAIRKNNIF